MRHVYKWAGIGYSLISMTRKKYESIDLKVFGKYKHLVKTIQDLYSHLIYQKA